MRNNALFFGLSRKEPCEGMHDARVRNFVSNLSVLPQNIIQMGVVGWDERVESILL